MNCAAPEVVICICVTCEPLSELHLRPSLAVHFTLADTQLDGE